MSKTIRNIILSTMIIGLIGALVVVVLPFTSAFAASEGVASNPAVISSSDPAAAAPRLELAFNRQKSIIARIGGAINNYGLVTDNVQKLLDRAKLKGKDASAIQTAFDALKTAFLSAKPFYDQAVTIVASQSGFDSNGKVIDIVKAKSTVKSLREVLQQYSGLVKPARLSLREAVINFRLANPRKNSTPAPTTTAP